MKAELTHQLGYEKHDLNAAAAATLETAKVASAVTQNRPMMVTSKPANDR
jgi:hypothetical protein